MSLINDMLRDLDTRKQQSREVLRINTVLGAPPAPDATPRTSWKFMVAIALSVIAGISGGYLFFHQLNQNSEQKITATAPVATPTTPAVVSAVISDAGNAQIEQIDKASNAVGQAALPNNVVLDIVQESSTDKGFSLRIRSTRAVQYNILSRDTYGIKLHLDGITNYSQGSTSFTGMSVLLESGGVNIDFDLEMATDFVVYEDESTPAFDIVVTASYRMMAPAVLVEPAVSEKATIESAPSLAIQPPTRSARKPVPFVSERNVPVRVAREQSLEERDRTLSNSAINQAKAGQFLEAYQGLLSFISEYPEAHFSRETLATLLIAQRDFKQAAIVIDEGLQLTPNFGGYKKIKARLLMQMGENAKALALLSALPPALNSDIEYHELLASLYQQVSQPEQAISIYQALIRNNSEVGRWWTALAISLESQGKKQDALAAYQAAMQKADIDNSLRQFSQSRIHVLSNQQ